MISVQEFNFIQFHEFACKEFVNFQNDHLPQESNHLLRMVMEPIYYAEEVILYTKHLLRIWLDA